MFAQQYIERLRRVVADLESRPDVFEVVAFEVRPPAPEEEIEAARSYGGLTRDMEEFFRVANGFRLEWRHIGDDEGDDEEAARGCVDIRPLDEIFTDHEGSIYFADDDRFKPLHPLDLFTEEACCALYLDGAAEPRVYYHYLGEEAATLELDFRGYLEKILRSRGFWYWPKSIAAPEFFNPYVPMSLEESRFRAVMPRLFADFSDREFQRLDRIDQIVGEADTVTRDAEEQREGRGGTSGAVVVTLGLLLIGAALAAFLLV